MTSRVSQRCAKRFFRVLRKGKSYKSVIHDELESYEEAFQKGYFIESTKKYDQHCCTNNRNYRVKGN
jgi:hypothetical protein